ncbi:MAG: CBS domain-containing protein, partial [Ruthenibacterium sp.]
MNENIGTQILELLKARKNKELHTLLSGMNCTDIAAELETLLEDGEITHEELLILFRILPKDTASDTFVDMNYDMQEALITGFNDRELHDVLDDIFMDDTVDIIEEMPANVVKRMLQSVNADARTSINQLLNYPENSAGSIMTIEYVDLKKTMTVEQAFARIRKTGVDKETIYTCYVTDRNRKLLGLVSVKD